MSPDTIITTIQDFNPDNIKLTDQVRKDFCKAVKHRLSDGSFVLEEHLARKLEFQSLIKEHITGRDANRNQIYSGRYVLDAFGELYIEYLQHAKREKMLNELRGWITTAIAFLAFMLALASLGWQIYEYYHPKITESAPVVYSEISDTMIAGIDKHSENHHGKPLLLM